MQIVSDNLHEMIVQIFFGIFRLTFFLSFFIDLYLASARERYTWPS